MKNIDFMDVPPLKILLPVSKGKTDDPGSTKAGKFSMLASRLRSCNIVTCKSTLELASYISDLTLNSSKMREPKYLPTVMGGCNVPDLFQSSWNTYAYVRTYNGGEYARVYGTATQELRETVSRLDNGLPAEAVFCQRLRQKQEYLFGTYKEAVAIPPQDLAGPLEGMPEPLYRQLGTSATFAANEGRLMRAKVLTPRSQALVQFESSKRLVDMICGIKPLGVSTNLHRSMKARAREAFEGALNANTAFKRLLKRQATGNEMALLRKENFLVIHHGQRDFAIEDAHWLKGGHGSVFTISDIPQSEDMFVTADVSMDRTMRVPGIELRPLGSKKISRVTTRAKLGLWQVSQEMEEWAASVVTQLQEKKEEFGRPLTIFEVKPILEKNREFTADDPYILNKCMEDCASEARSQTVFLLSSDRKLAKKMAELTSDFVVRLEPTHVISKLRLTTINSGTEIPVSVIESILEPQFCEIRRIPPARRVYIDYGSVEANSLVLDYKPHVRKLILRDVQEFGRSETKGRFVVTEETILDRYAEMCTAEIFWPNTIKIDFEVALTEPTTKRARPQKKIFAETPVRWLKKYLR